MTGYHTRWARPETQADDPERIAIREALAFGKALYDRRITLGLSIPDLAQRTGMTADEIECIEEGGTEPTIACCGAGPPPWTQRAPDRTTRPRLGELRVRNRAVRGII